MLHDLPLVTPFADNILLMSKQKMVAFASPNTLMHDDFITPVFGLRVIPFSHPRMHNTIHHFEAASSYNHLSLTGST